MDGEYDAKFGENSSFMQGDVCLTAPEVTARESYTLRAILTDGTGKVLHYTDESIEVFPRTAEEPETAISVSGEEFLARLAELTSVAASGKTVVVNGLESGTYDIAGTEVKVKACGMRALHFVSRKTGHPLVEGFTPYDFRLWYDAEKDRITPLLRHTFTADGMTPILTSGNSLTASAWGQKLYPAFACAEMQCGNGKIILNEVDLDSHLANPVARIFKNRLMRY